MISFSRFVAWHKGNWRISKNSTNYKNVYLRGAAATETPAARTIVHSSNAGHKVVMKPQDGRTKTIKRKGGTRGREKRGERKKRSEREINWVLRRIKEVEQSSHYRRLRLELSLKGGNATVCLSALNSLALWRADSRNRLMFDWIQAMPKNWRVFHWNFVIFLSFASKNFSHEICHYLVQKWT